MRMLEDKDLNAHTSSLQEVMTKNSTELFDAIHADLLNTKTKPAIVWDASKNRSIRDTYIGKKK